MTLFFQYASKAAALVAKPDLQVSVDDKGNPITPVPDTSKGMIVTAYSAAPSADGKTPGTLATGAFVLDATVIAQLGGTPLQLPAGIKYISPIYFGMSVPLPG